MKPFSYVRSLSCCLSIVVTLSACGGGSSSAPEDSLPPDGAAAGDGGSDTPDDDQGDPGHDAPDDDQPEQRIAFPYVRDGPFADVLWECTASWVFQPCSFETLPLIGAESANPQVADILDRLLVSHGWIGDNFRTVLEQLPDDALLLFRSTTGIVISDDFAGNQFFLGKVYLDPILFWLTPAQRDDLSDATRGTTTSDGLRFRMPWRYVKNGIPLRFTGPDIGPRTENDMVSAAAVALFHELAHAVDWMPVSEIGNVTAPEDAPNNRLAVAWHESYPMRSGVQTTDLLLYELAQVRFDVESATPAQRAIQPEELIAPFAEEGAVRFYSYVDVGEDFATAYETAMMAFHFDYHQETAITGNMAESVNDEIVLWGQRGRIGEQRVYARVLGAVQSMYPGNLSAIEAFLAAQPPPMQMKTGITWRAAAGSTE